MSSPLGQGPSSALDSTYGAMLIGVLFATFFHGLLTVQTFNYYENFPKDPLRHKIVVALVWSLDTMHLAFIGQAAYHYLVTNWGYFPALMMSTWELDINLTFIGLSSFLCQMFFLYRIWVFSHGNLIIIVPLMCLCLTTLVLDILVTARIISAPLVSEFGESAGEIIAVFTTGAAADLIIAVILCYYLQHGRSGFERTNSLIAQVIRYVVVTGLAASALEIGAIIAYFAKPDGFYFVAMHFSLGRLYTNALLATLNARKKMRDPTNSSQKSISKPTIPAQIRSNKISRFISQGDSPENSQNEQNQYTYTIERTTHGDDIELGSLSHKEDTSPFP